jgi:3-dehydroquinate synthase
MPQHSLQMMTNQFANKQVPDMEHVSFRFAERRMDIFSGYQCTASIAAHIGDLTEHVVLVADELVYREWGAALELHLRAHVKLSVCRINAVESEKSMSVVQSILDQAVADGATRRSVVLSFGGGLTGNLAGLAAGLLFRGIRLFHMPTTLLAMSDSILSQKQAINGAATKNMYGLYHMADCCLIDVQYLHTLPQKEFSAGVVELIKNGLAFDETSLPQLKRLIRPDSTPADWLALVKLGIDSKQLLLEDDPFEGKLGVVLEYGHTVGHALELETGTLTHGHAVGLGMLVAAAISTARGWITEDDEWLHARVLLQAGAPVTLPKPVTFQALLERIKRDNKRGRIALSDKQYAFVLLQQLGKPALTQELPLVAVSEAEIEQAFSKLASGYYGQVKAA